MNKKYDPIPKSQANIDAFGEEKKKFVVSTSSWTKLSDIPDWSIFDPKRMYAIKIALDKDIFPMFIKWDWEKFEIISSHDTLRGMAIDEFSEYFDDHFIKEFKND